jgi:hypothetical protein
MADKLGAGVCFLKSIAEDGKACRVQRPLRGNTFVIRGLGQLCNDPVLPRQQGSVKWSEWSHRVPKDTAEHVAHLLTPAVAKTHPGRGPHGRSDKLPFSTSGCSDSDIAGGQIGAAWSIECGSVRGFHSVRRRHVQFFPRGHAVSEPLRYFNHLPAPVIPKHVPAEAATCGCE